LVSEKRRAQRRHTISKLLFLPVSIATGVIAGLVSKKAFAMLWRAIDDRDPPQPENRGSSPGKLAVALALEGALFGVVMGLVDHASRRGFAQLTGSWPGEPQADDA
jgi:hypothetical protein